MVAEDEDVLIIGDDGTLIRTSVADISLQGRDASGVRVMKVNEGHRVAAVAPLFTGDEDEESDEPHEVDADGEPVASVDADAAGSEEE